MNTRVLFKTPISNWRDDILCRNMCVGTNEWNSTFQTIFLLFLYHRWIVEYENIIKCWNNIFFCCWKVRRQKKFVHHFLFGFYQVLASACFHTITSTWKYIESLTLIHKDAYSSVLKQAWNFTKNFSTIY